MDTALVFQPTSTGLGDGLVASVYIDVDTALVFQPTSMGHDDGLVA